MRSICLDRLVRRPGLVGVPVVRRERAHRAGRVVGQRGELHLGPPGVVALVAGQGVALGGEGLVERGADLVERAAEVAAPARRVAHPAHLGGQVVEAAVAVEALPQQVPERLAQRPAGEHVAPDRVQGGPHVVRRSERVGPVVPGSVAEAGTPGSRGGVSGATSDVQAP